MSMYSTIFTSTLSQMCIEAAEKYNAETRKCRSGKAGKGWAEALDRYHEICAELAERRAGAVMN